MTRNLSENVGGTGRWRPVATGATDLTAMQELAIRLWSPTAWWHPGGLAWHMLSVPDPSEFTTAVWREGQQVVAWARVEPGGLLTALIDPQHPALAEEIVTWFAGNAAQATDADTALRGTLARAGFTQAGDSTPFALDMRRPSFGIDTVPVAEGYRIRGAKPDESAALVALHRASWNPNELPSTDDARPEPDPTAQSTFTIEAMRRVETARLYRRDLHVVAETNDGELAASCIAWLDPPPARLRSSRSARIPHIEATASRCRPVSRPCVASKSGADARS